MDRDKPLLIVNPRSGRGLDERAWAKLAAPVADGLGPFDVRFTEAGGHARELAREAAAAGRALVVAMGGDGTISEVADGLLAAGGDTALGIIPRGTGGDLRRTLGLPDDVREAAARIRAAAPRAIDAGRATITTPDGATATRHFVNEVSFGFSADIAERANASSKRFGGKVAFLGATMRSLVSYDNIDVAISVDGGERRRMTVLMAAIGNGCFFGGGMKICPDARLDDGKLDLVTIGDLGRLEILAKINRLYDGTHLALPEVQATQVRTVEIWPADAKATIPLEIDGETPARLPAKIEVLPGALRLRA